MYLQVIINIFTKEVWSELEFGVLKVKANENMKFTLNLISVATLVTLVTLGTLGT